MRLGKTLSLISRLRKDLSAEIVHQEEITEDVYEEERHLDWYRDIWVGVELVQERIAEPDYKKRKIAREELQKLYGDSRYCSVKCKAACALGINREFLSDKVDYWLNELSEGNNSDLNNMFLVLGHNFRSKLSQICEDENNPLKIRVIAEKALKYTKLKPKKNRDILQPIWAVGCLTTIIGVASLVCYGVYKYLEYLCE